MSCVSPQLMVCGLTVLYFSAGMVLSASEHATASVDYCAMWSAALVWSGLVLCGLVICGLVCP